MLHVTTEIGKPGRRERERRHYPHIDNRSSLPHYRARGRRYIPHGYGFYSEWTPHNQNVQVEYTENGPDWSSKLKYIPHPSDPKYPAAEIFENNWKAMRPFPHTYKRTDREWLLDPGLTKVGLRCNFGGVHKATDTSSEEITHQMLFGKGRREFAIDKRNGLSMAAPGDKNYQAVEYCPGFHKQGSTRPAPVFGANYKPPSINTFVPLIPLPLKPRDNFRESEAQRQKEEDVNSVRNLESWKPATPLGLTLPQIDDKK